MFMMNEHLHTYSLVATGLKRSYSRVFASRDAANEFMYKLCGKYNLAIKETWNDKHDKTYHCDNGVIFYIQRM